MGAHTLGGAEQENSGYQGAWVSGGTSHFNNKYYELILDSSLTFENVVSIFFSFYNCRVTQPNSDVTKIAMKSK